ncbi:MAG: hypothetical protein A2W18_07655 [Candidatus Muproteobacteria bacterium RBG_16_60_9]|uniref:VOC domain-containing protein n=1 Tax=Candidatus Muproteobacteria bacterium RBG_16_60_9 TaxID=1817755 RepID=A0A1F6V4G4_9PROT|nr:MAG: hypothetical protein A2W18_07655 [Candidatus Muproteobacteria bacterium RBG_16_60_9]
MTTTGLNHINLHAKRELLDALKEFYCDVVGLHIGSRPAFRNFGYWHYAGDKSVVHLYRADPMGRGRLLEIRIARSPSPATGGRGNPQTP